MTTSTAARSQARANAQPAAPEDTGWPAGLTLILVLLVVFAGNIAAVVYLASQMPS